MGSVSCPKMHMTSVWCGTQSPNRSARWPLTLTKQKTTLNSKLEICRHTWTGRMLTLKEGRKKKVVKPKNDTTDFWKQYGTMMKGRVGTSRVKQIFCWTGSQKCVASWRVLSGMSANG